MSWGSRGTEAHAQHVQLLRSDHDQSLRGTLHRAGCSGVLDSSEAGGSWCRPSVPRMRAPSPLPPPPLRYGTPAEFRPSDALAALCPSPNPPSPPPHNGVVARRTDWEFDDDDWAWIVPGILGAPVESSQDNDIDLMLSSLLDFYGTQLPALLLSTDIAVGMPSDANTGSTRGAGGGVVTAITFTIPDVILVSDQASSNEREVTASSSTPLHPIPGTASLAPATEASTQQDALPKFPLFGALSSAGGEAMASDSAVAALPRTRDASRAADLIILPMRDVARSPVGVHDSGADAGAGGAIDARWWGLVISVPLCCLLVALLAIKQWSPSRTPRAALGADANDYRGMPGVAPAAHTCQGPLDAHEREWLSAAATSAGSGDADFGVVVGQPARKVSNLPA